MGGAIWRRKFQIIIEYYNQEERIIEGTKIDAGSAKRFQGKRIERGGNSKN